MAMSKEHMEICRRMYKVYFSEDETIFEQGDPGDSFFYILTGNVRVLAFKSIGMVKNKKETTKVV